MRRAAVLWALAAACRGGEAPPARTGDASAPPTATATEPSEAPLFPDGTHSLRLTRTVGVRLQPDDTAKRIGTVAIDTRVAWTRTAPGHGCTRPWIEIAPRGWVCGDYVAASKHEPYGQEVPPLDRGEIVPGVYGKITEKDAVTYELEKPGRKRHRDHDRDKDRAKDRDRHRDRDKEKDAKLDPKSPHMIEGEPVVGSVNVRQYDAITIDDKAYWKIAQKDNTYVLASAITPHSPSSYRGDRLDDAAPLDAPIVVAFSRAGAKTLAIGGGRSVPARSAWAALETRRDQGGHALAYRVDATGWLAADDAREFHRTAKPDDVAASERWIDVDLDAQILVAFEGERAVFATMVSSGGKDTPTETGVYRIWLKESEADMKGLNGEDPYSVATVPWTQYFYPDKGLALHTAYWHDQFGTRRSHGCVNLAPRDARWLYFWSDPQVPPGWTSAQGLVELPGSIVRVRSAADPTPEKKGYAKNVTAEATTPSSVP